MSQKRNDGDDQDPSTEPKKPEQDNETPHPTPWGAGPDTD